MAAQRTIAVLPFDDLAEAGGAGWLARGFAEDLTTELARFAQLEVIHPHSSFAVDPRRTADAELGRELGASFLLRGTVRRDRESMVVSVRVVDTPTGRQLWAERFTAPVARALAVQAEIAEKVAGALALEIDAARLRHARGRPLADLEAYDCWLRGLEALRDGTVEDDARARTLFEHALELDPRFARAWLGISLSHFNEWSCQSWEAWDEKERLAYEAARKALALDDSDHVVQLILGRIELYRRNFDEAERRFELSLQINRNDADALVQVGLGMTYLGRLEEAVALVEKAMRLNPKHGDWYFAFLVYPLFALRRYDEAIRCARRAGDVTVDLPAFRAASSAYAGDAAGAAAGVESFSACFREKILFGREPEPGEPLRWLLHVNPYLRPEDEQHLVEGLARAGLALDPDARARAEVAVGADLPVFVRDGDAWRMVWDGRAVTLNPVKGFDDLRSLLAAPGEAFHCLELAGRPASASDGDEVLDREARVRVERRIRELQAELDEAEAAHDLGHAERARAELDALVDDLSKALGIRGRPRRLGSAAEKARSAVTWRIRSAIKKIAAAHSGLGRHLENAVRTGNYCAYEPERRVDWRL